MCGIYVTISRHGYCPANSHLRNLLQQRGPDAFLEEYFTVPIDPQGSKVYVSIASSVLALRGDDVVAQPIFHNATRSFLCWNGEAWRLNEHRQEVTGNDAQAVFQMLTANLNIQNSTTAHTAIYKSFESIHGPFAMTFFDSRYKKLYFGRDCLGRRSLLTGKHVNGDLVISSLPNLITGVSWTEIEADSIYYIKLGRRDNSGTGFETDRVPYVPPNSPLIQLIPEYIDSHVPDMNKSTPDQGATSLSRHSQAVCTLENLLLTSLRLRVCNVRSRKSTITPSASPEPKVAILFSGGLDCSVLARLSHELLPPDETIDLLNVAFENPRIHSDSTISPYELCPDRITARRSQQELQCSCPGRVFRLVTIDIPYSETLAHRTTITSLMHPHNTEMDLSIATALYFASRGIGTTSNAAPADESITNGISPESCNSNFETNYSSSSTPSTPYTTPARVLLSGLGADELFAGYHRHAIAFQHRGYPGLIDELELDYSRLGKRNLGRDDRVISHWGREARYPYLDEDLVAWALRAPVWEKCGFGMESAGVGDLEDGKLVLRLVAERLGLMGVARERKRAIQFGARTAKMESGKVKGTTMLDGL